MAAEYFKSWEIFRAASHLSVNRSILFCINIIPYYGAFLFYPWVSECSRLWNTSVGLSISKISGNQLVHYFLLPSINSHLFDHFLLCFPSRFKANWHNHSKKSQNRFQKRQAFYKSQYTSVATQIRLKHCSVSACALFFSFLRTMLSARSCKKYNVRYRNHLRWMVAPK